MSDIEIGSSSLIPNSLIGLTSLTGSYPIYSDGTNSPILMESDEELEEVVVENIFENTTLTNTLTKHIAHRRPKQLTFAEVKQSLDRYYGDSEDKFSTELDILITFIKGQKHLYMKARVITQAKLNLFRLPSLFFTAAITVFAPLLQGWMYSGMVISILNALTTLMISMMHHLKLEASCELYTQLAIQYDKMENALQQTGSKLLFSEMEYDGETGSNYGASESTQVILAKLRDMEKKINEIKETTPIFVPEELKLVFPIICHINVFSFIKRVETYKKNLIVRFRDIKNELLMIEDTWTKRKSETSHERKRYDHLIEMKDKVRHDLLYYRNVYGSIDEIFTHEIQRAEMLSMWGLYWRLLFRMPLSKKYDGNMNPVVESYLNVIFSK